MSIASRITISLLTLGLVSVASCAGSGSTDFEGTWTYNPGSSATVTCPTGTNTADAGGNEDVRPGTDSDLVVISSDGCNIKFNATGNHADAIPGQSCTSLQSGVTTTTTFNNASYTMQDDVLSFTAAGTIRLMGPGGEVTCTMTASATLHKVSN